MSWITIVPIAFFLLLALNSIIVVFWIRPRLERNGRVKPRKHLKGNISLTGFIVFGLMVIVLIVGLAAQQNAPTSQLAEWIEKHGMVTYWAWCGMVTTILIIVLELLGYPWKTEDAA